MGEQTGKIPYGVFESFLKDKCGMLRSEVSMQPRFGVDVALVDLPGSMTMALCSDPLSLIPSLGLRESAWLSVHLLANDMATTGKAPMYGQFVLNLPDTFSKDDFKNYWDDIHRFSTEIGLAITGGHTGFIPGQYSSIAGGATFIAVAPTGTLITSANAEPGDLVLVTKSCALSSAAILAMSFPDTVKHKAGMEIYHKACASFYSTSSLQDALLAVSGSAEENGVKAMHDVTEGGVLGAIIEMAVASGNGVRVDDDRLPVDEVQASVCGVFSLDPRYCVGAGSMVIACKKDKAENIIGRLAQHDIPCTVVGEICAAVHGYSLCKDGLVFPLKYNETDPYWAAYFKAYHAGWK